MKTQLMIARLTGTILCLLMSLSVAFAAPRPTGVTVSTSYIAATCHGTCDGTATAMAADGTAPYTYVWSTSDTGATVNNMCAGTYWVTVSDALGDTASTTVIVPEPTALSVTFTYRYSSANCSDSSIATVSGGTAPYTYSWHNGAHTSTTNVFNYVCAGETDTLVVTDVNGCSITAYAVNNHIRNNMLVLRTVSCYGVCDAIASASPQGGVPPYTYRWNTSPIQTTDTVSGLCAGTYSTTVYDSHGDSVVKSVTLTQPSQLTINTSYSTHGSCTDTVFAAVTGGSLPYNYNWGNYNSTSAYLPYVCSGQSYTLTVTDGHGCTQVVNGTFPTTFPLTGSTHLIQNASCSGGCIGSGYVTASGGVPPYTYMWNNASTNDSITGLCAGTYSVTVTDSVGNMDTVTLAIAQSGSTSLFISYRFGATACTDTGLVSVSGGTPPYTYYWHSGAHTSTTSTLDNICSGETDTLTVTDSTGCSTTIISTNHHLNGYAAVLRTVSCYGSCDGVAAANVTVGSSPYTYKWSTSPVQTTDTVNGLCAGTYNVTIFDASGDSLVKSATITQPAQLTITISHTTHGSCTDTVFAAVHGGSTPYNYNWGNYNSTSAYLPYVCNGQSYSLTVTDGHGCTQVINDTFPTVFPLVATTHLIQNTGCYLACNGSGYVTATGGVPPYTYLWSNASTNDTITGRCPGTYQVIATDSIGNMDTTTLTIQQNPSITVDLGPDRTVDCMESAGGWINPYVTGGSGSYTYDWHAVGIPDSIIYYATAVSDFTGGTAVVGIPGSYILNVSDGNGCSASDTVDIENANSSIQLNGPYTICLGSAASFHITGTNQVIGWTKYQNGVFTNLGNTTVDLIDTPTVTTYYIAHVRDTSYLSCTVALLREVVVDTICDVWPGDANFDGIANNADILAIGLDYADTGPVRSGASLVWIGQAATDWANNTPNGPNEKHADCDGNGVINADDTLAVTLNYGLTHSKGAASSLTSPEVYIQFPNNYRVAAGQTIQVPIYLGTTGYPVDSIYGICFTVNYDNTLIDSTNSQLSVAGSWLGNNGGNLLQFRKNFYNSSQTPVAISRTNHANIGGNGLLATISYTMKDDISGKQQIVKYLRFSISDVTAVMANGTPVIVSSEKSADSTEAFQYTGIDQPTLQDQLTVYPNPASQQLIVNAGKVQIEEYLITDLLGKVVLTTTNPKSNITTFDVSGLSQGVYILRAKTGDNVANIKFVIQR